MADLIRIALAGEGGQGVMSVADILAQAANAEGRETLYIPAFGVEQRGGVAQAFVQISDEKIGFPRFKKADILVVLSGRSVARMASYVKPGTTYVYDSSMIEDSIVNETIADRLAGCRVLRIPATEVCKNELNTRVFNIMILGAVLEATKVLPVEAIKKALEKSLGHKFAQKPELREMNYKALERGMELVRLAQ